MDSSKVSDPLGKYLELQHGVKSPADAAVKGFNALTKDQGVLTKAGEAYCLTQQPQLYTYAFGGGAGLGLLVGVLATVIIHTLFGRRRAPQKPAAGPLGPQGPVGQQGPVGPAERT